MKDILRICRDVAAAACVQEPTTLFNNPGQNEKIFLSIAGDALNGLLRYGDWQELIKDGELRTAEGKCDYPTAFFCPDFYRLLNNTVYIRDSAEKVIGAVTPEQWQRDKYLSAAGGKIKFKIQNSMFRFLTPPPGGLKIVFQYRSSAVAYDGKTLTEKSELSADTDIPVFDEYLVKLAIRWRLQARNGQNYEEEYAEYEKECRKRFAETLATRDICPAAGRCGETNDTGVIIHAKTDN